MLIEKIWKQFKIAINPDDMISKKGCKGTKEYSWFTLSHEPPVKSQLTMWQCVKCPIEIIKNKYEIEIVLAINEIKKENSDDMRKLH